MRVFVTGATGFIGSEVVKELIGSGHHAIGLARSDAGAKLLAAAGAQVHRGDLSDLESLRSGAAGADAVIHTAFIHDFSKFAENCAIDKQAIEALGSALEGSDRPLLVTSGIATTAEGRPSTEEDDPPPEFPRVSETTAEKLVERGVRAATVRLPQVHDTRKQGLISYAMAVAREKGVAAYVGEGRNRWAAVHVLDAARLYRLALERQEAGARYHAVAEEGVSAREIAEAIGRGLRVPVVSISPEEAAGHFGWLAMFAGRDLTGSSVLTQQRLGWRPTRPGLIADLDGMQYFAAKQTA
ncbi:MAG TPA: SDR family oxidoreductase [Candidatus Aquilonibacter sp.]|nr:SDR family oxidoreductase [Candidatus Aquilonibacter sp.]